MGWPRFGLIPPFPDIPHAGDTLFLKNWHYLRFVGQLKKEEAGGCYGTYTSQTVEEELTQPRRAVERTLVAKLPYTLSYIILRTFPARCGPHYDYLDCWLWIPIAVLTFLSPDPDTYVPRRY